MNQPHQTQIHMMKIITCSSTHAIMYDALDHKVYRFVDSNTGDVHPTHDQMVISMKPYLCGRISEHYASTLKSRLKSNLSSHPPIAYSESELLNTFEELVKYVVGGSQHGAISPDSIVVTHDYQIKLLHPTLLPPTSRIYHTNDCQALALVMCECGMLCSYHEVQQICKDDKQIVKRLSLYSDKLIGLILMLLHNMKQLYTDLTMRTQQWNKLLRGIKEMRDRQMRVVGGVLEKKVIKVPPLKISDSMKKGKVTVTSLYELPPKENNQHYLNSSQRKKIVSFRINGRTQLHPKR